MEINDALQSHQVERSEVLPERTLVEATPEGMAFKQEIETAPARSRSRLKPWSCGCTRVWASAGVTLEATCDKRSCGKPFLLK